MHSDKLPGQDGMNTCTLPLGLSDTIIVLIPKNKTPEKVIAMRPILLCNVLYKIVAKTLANILNKVVGDVVGEAHSAFI